MIFVLAAWVCMLLAIALAWLWLQSLPEPQHGAHYAGDDSHVRATRTTARSLAMLSALSLAMLLLHFVVPTGEARAEAEWTARGEARMPGNYSDVPLNGRHDMLPN